MANGSFLFFQCWKVAYLMRNCPETAFFRLSTELARIRGLAGGGGVLALEALYTGNCGFNDKSVPSLPPKGILMRDKKGWMIIE